ncbi:hypothetical protein C8R47DRAFT_1105044 [Mycena vitilis]|nr:hypothetical protein C8R47DRAFT_1105044 [Mycena vitilis]
MRCGNRLGPGRRYLMRCWLSIALAGFCSRLSMPRRSPPSPTPPSLNLSLSHLPPLPPSSLLATSPRSLSSAPSSACAPRSRSLKSIPAVSPEQLESLNGFSFWLLVIGYSVACTGPTPDTRHPKLKPRLVDPSIRRSVAPSLRDSINVH